MPKNAVKKIFPCSLPFQAAGCRPAQAGRLRFICRCFGIRAEIFRKDSSNELPGINEICLQNGSVNFTPKA